MGTSKLPGGKDHKVTRCWGAPTPVPKKDFDARFNLHLVPGGGYGSTDAGWVVAPQWDHPGGIVLPHFEVSIHDENDDPLPAGQAGEMVVRPSRTRCYVRWLFWHARTHPRKLAQSLVSYR